MERWLAWLGRYLRRYIQGRKQVSTVVDIPVTEEHYDSIFLESTGDVTRVAFTAPLHFVDKHFHTNVLHVSMCLWDLGETLHVDIERWVTTQQLLHWEQYPHVVMLLHLRDDESLDDVLHQLLQDNKDISTALWSEANPVLVVKHAPQR